MRYQFNILEEELKNKVGDDFFHKYNCDDVISQAFAKAGYKVISNDVSEYSKVIISHSPKAK